MDYKKKRNLLLKNIRGLARQGLAVAFSGGVDSSLLLTLCCEAGKDLMGTAERTGPGPACDQVRKDHTGTAERTGPDPACDQVRKDHTDDAKRINAPDSPADAPGTRQGPPVYAVTFLTRLHPAADLEIARRVARQTGAEHVVLSADELDEAGIENNPADRCYRCKKLLFQKLSTFAKERGIRVLLDGTNADDLTVYRPGLRALKELGVLSPLADAGFSKEDVRRMASEYGIPVADRPSAPCLATRFPYGTKLDYALLRKVDDAEGRLRDMGFSTVRVRIHRDIARLEIEPSDMPRALALRDEILLCIQKTGVDYVTLDLAGFRSGSMDLHVKSGDLDP